jgi:hypothetical protein
MKVAKLLLAAAIAAPSIFLTSCEKQIDVQAETMNREATRSLAKPAAVQFAWYDAVDEAGVYTLNAQPNVSCGTGTLQRLDGTKWVDVAGMASVSFSLEPFITLVLPAKPASGTQYRVFYVPEKGKAGCPDNLQRGGSAPFIVQ